MVIGCANKTIKYLVFFFNFLAFVSGIVIISAAATAVLSPAFTHELSKYVPHLETLRSALYVAIAVGAILMIIGFLGCCGAQFEIRCLLCVFSTIMVILLIAQLAAGVTAIVEKDQIEPLLNQGLSRMDKAIEYKEDEACKLWTYLQTELSCCGVDGKEIGKLGICPELACTAATRDKGCAKTIADNLNKGALTLGIIAIVIIMLELIAIILSCCLCASINKQGEMFT